MYPCKRKKLDPVYIGDDDYACFLSSFVWVEFLTINFSNKFMKKLFKWEHF